ncbi:MAG: signal peptidase I [Firmicutes bacterium]|nr:signal peptidase I [Bacillota bacterium]
MEENEKLNNTETTESENETTGENISSQEINPTEEYISKQTFVKTVREIVICAAQVIILTMLIINFIGRISVVQGQSMYPSLTTNNRIVINLLAYKFHEPRRGEIIVFRCPRNPERDYIKRVIGLPGEEIAIIDGKVFINGRILNEPYIMKTLPDESIETVRLGKNEIFVMGDNRSNSEDSRSWGALDEKLIKGKAELVFWPPEALNICK